MLHAFSDEIVFILCASGTYDDNGMMEVFRDIEELNRKLVEYSEEELEDYRVLHGLLASVKVIPKDFCGLFPYLVVEDLMEPGQGTVVESDADVPQELTVQIEKALSKVSDSDPDVEYTIDDIFVLYGYELTLTQTANLQEQDRIALCIDEFDVNDIQIGEANKILREISRLKVRHKEYFRKGTAV
jgi:hypothetical protein